MNRVLVTIAEDEGYTIILERNESSILYARGSMDLTNELIRKYNKLLEAEKKGGTPAAEKKGKKPAEKKKDAAPGSGSN